MNDIVNVKKGHNIMNDSFAHKLNGLLIEIDINNTILVC